jgi:hypothetical protein
MNTLRLSFIITVLLHVRTLSAFAQNNQESAVDTAAVMIWQSKRFTFSKPDSGFVALAEGSGYTNAGMNASIKYLSFPQKYYKVKNQYKNQKPAEATLFIDSISHKSKGREAFTLIHEEVSPDKTMYENYISLMTIVDFGEITVCIVGAYPKSKDKLLREKYLKAALSIKEK